MKKNYKRCTRPYANLWLNCWKSGKHDYPAILFHPRTHCCCRKSRVCLIVFWHGMALHGIELSGERRSASDDDDNDDMVRLL